MRPTRRDELNELERKVSALRADLREETRPRQREALERKIAGAAEAERLINARHDRWDAEARERERDSAERLAAVHQASEEAIRRELRRRWSGDDASFAAAWPRLLEEYRVDAALGRRSVTPAVPSPNVTI